MTIYERIKSLREALGMSQDELARKVGYKGRSAISKVESGSRDISQSMIEKYANALGVSPTFLLYGTETNTHEDPQDDLYNMITRLDIVDRAEIRGIVRQMLKADKYSKNKESKHA